MKPEAQRIAIATACGWREFLNEGLYGWKTEDENENAQPVPDYLNDLNAMHEAEHKLFKTHDAMGVSVYYHTLVSMCENNPALAVQSTAAQRAESFLRTLNLWTE